MKKRFAIACVDNFFVVAVVVFAGAALLPRAWYFCQYFMYLMVKMWRIQTHLYSHPFHHKYHNRVLQTASRSSSSSRKKDEREKWNVLQEQQSTVINYNVCALYTYRAYMCLCVYINARQWRYLVTYKNSQCVWCEKRELGPTHSTLSVNLMRFSFDIFFGAHWIGRKQRRSNAGRKKRSLAPEHTERERERVNCVVVVLMLLVYLVNGRIFIWRYCEHFLIL